MHETIVAAGHDAQSQLDAAAVAKLCLLARWLLHCHERTRQRGQLGVLARPLHDTSSGHIDCLEASSEPGWT
jgi:hypothetical protein